MEHFAVMAIFEELWLERIEEFMRILQWEEKQKEICLYFDFKFLSIFHTSYTSNSTITGG